MSDLLERLRRDESARTSDEAADEIERLRAKLSAAEKVVEAARPIGRYRKDEDQLFAGYWRRNPEVKVNISVEHGKLVTLGDALVVYDAAKGGNGE